MIIICKTLRAEILHVQTPQGFKPNETNAHRLDAFFNSVDLKNVKMALEVRGANQELSSDFVETMKNHDMIHSIDLSKDEEPAYRSGVLYSRLFGKGEHNIYQPTDLELENIHNKASSKAYKKALVSFHFVRMYKDAMRLERYRETGKFQMATGSTGTKSLQKTAGFQRPNNN